MNTEDIVWSAGLLEGEGSFYWRLAGAKVSCAMTDLDILERLQDIWGGGLVATKRQQEHHKQAWAWYVHGQPAVDLMEYILPYMGKRRTERIKGIIQSHINRQAEVAEKRQKIQKTAQQAAQDYLDGKGSLRTLAKQYHISYVTVKNYADLIRSPVV